MSGSSFGKRRQRGFFSPGSPRVDFDDAADDLVVARGAIERLQECRPCTIAVPADEPIVPFARFGGDRTGAQGFFARRRGQGPPDRLEDPSVALGGEHAESDAGGGGRARARIRQECARDRRGHVRQLEGRPRSFRDGAEKAADARDRDLHRGCAKVGSARVRNDEHDAIAVDESVHIESDGRRWNRRLDLGIGVGGDAERRSAGSHRNPNVRRPRADDAAKPWRGPALERARRELEVQVLQYAAPMPEAGDAAGYVDRKADPSKRRLKLGDSDAAKRGRTRELETHALPADRQAKPYPGSALATGRGGIGGAMTERPLRVCGFRARAHVVKKSARA